MPITSLKKISAKTVIGSPAQIRGHVAEAEKSGKKVAMLFSVYGIANSFKVGESNFGEYTAFKGDFRAINVLTGEEFASSTLFLPDDITPVLVAAIDADQGTGIQFAFQVGARKTDTTIGYEYYLESKKSITQDNVLDELRKTLVEPELKKLPTPKAADKKKSETTNKK